MNIEVIEKLISESGNNFHAKVAQWFNTNGWNVTISPYYMDQTQFKTREIDLVVEKEFPIQSHYSSDVRVLIRLFVECKFVATETVFWFEKKNKSAAEKLVCRFQPFKENNKYTDQHHYLSTNENVAKIFASNNNKSHENDPFFKALNQILNATIAMRNKKPLNKYTNVILEYPIVVCSDFSKLYSVNFYDESKPSIIKENFQMEVQYAYLHDEKQFDEYFIVDFLEFHKISSYEDVLWNDAKAAAMFLT